MGKQTTIGRMAVAMLVAVLALFLAGATAGAQDPGDPYGGTTTTAPGALAATCDLSLTQATVGTGVTATVDNVPLGGTVRIMFGGSEVGRATASQAGSASVTVDFTVPDVEPGTYLVHAVGDSFTATCNAGANGEFAVLAETVTNDGGGSSLPRTGIFVGLLVAIGLGFVVFGRGLVGESRRRRRSVQARELDDPFASVGHDD